MMSMLPTDLTFTHIVAVVFLASAWMGYGPILTVLSKGSLNSQLGRVRNHWVDVSTRRENRTFDALLLGHIINSVAFFGSATLIVMAGLVGTFANVQRVHETVIQLPFVKSKSVELFAGELAVIVCILMICFFLFTYALRKLIYCVALTGALFEGPAETNEHRAMVAATSQVLTNALKSFNSGIRGYYFSVAALFLFVDPMACIIATAAVTCLLFYRQIFTQTAKSIGDYVQALDKQAADTKQDIDKAG